MFNDGAYADELFPLFPARTDEFARDVHGNTRGRKYTECGEGHGGDGVGQLDGLARCAIDLPRAVPTGALHRVSSTAALARSSASIRARWSASIRMTDPMIVDMPLFDDERCSQMAGSGGDHLELDETSGRQWSKGRDRNTLMTVHCGRDLKLGQLHLTISVNSPALAIVFAQH